ncbi:CPBP family glutamic-type intramembrane protease [Bacillus sp. AK128]
MSIFKKSLIFALLGFIAGVSLIPVQSEMFESILTEQGVKPPSLPLLIILTGGQIALISFISSFIGLVVSKKVNLQLGFHFSKLWILLAVGGGMGGMGIILLMDLYVFLPQIPEIGNTDVTWWKGLLNGVLYGGIFEEVLLRLFLMSLIIWILIKITKRKNIPTGYYIVGIILSSVIFTAAHLPANALLVGELTPIVVVRVLVMNGLLGMFYGYLYWKQGLIYGMISHMSSHIFLYGIIYGLVL